MDKEQLIARLMTTFLDEFEEHIRALDRDLLELEREPNGGRPELLVTLFRTVHSLKGAARSVSVTLVEATCHRLEDILGAVRDGHREVDAELIQLLFETADGLRHAKERLRAQEPLAGGPLIGLLPRLDTAAGQGQRDKRPPKDHAPAPLPRATPAPTGRALDGFVRVPAERLDTLLAQSDELLVARRRVATQQEDLQELHELIEQSHADWHRVEKPLRGLLASKGDAEPARAERRLLAALERTRDNLKRVARGIDGLASRVAADHRVLDHAARPLEDQVRRVRMLPFRDACEGLARVVRDLARTSSKDVALVIEGGDVQIDRSLLEGLRDPLLQLVRNAVGHGIESPGERVSRAKPATGQITVAARLHGVGVEVVVADDGRGLSLERIREQARKRRIPIPDDERELAQLVFLPGFSTAGLVTELSGRGVGLDVVKHGVESLHGSVDLSFVPERGTRFVLRLPLTLTTLRGLLIGCGGQVFVLPTTSVRRLMRVGSSELGAVEGREVLLGDAAPIPVAALPEVLAIATGPMAHSSTGKVAVVVVQAGRKQVAFVVDELLAEQEFVVKSLGGRLRHVRNVAGATMLPTGRLALILNPAELVASALGRSSSPRVAEALEERAAPSKRRLLVVDDSVTTRSLERTILEAAGYQVTTAVDGADAWQRLQTDGADLVVTDVEMPRMDGFALTQAIRGSLRFRELPVILVTALESAEHQARGLEVGADAYLPKSAFDQRQLLATIAQLL